MRWKKLNEIVSMYEKPVLGKVKSEKRYMALSVDKSTLKNKTKIGIAREITKSKGHPDIPGFVDESKLIIVKSEDLLNWIKISDLNINNIENIIEKISGEDKYFIGLEDPDIFVDELGIKHVYFTIAFKLKNRIGYKVYLGHAKGKSLENLTSTNPILGPLSGIDGFKETCISPFEFNGKKYILNEILVYNKNEDYSAVSLSTAKNIGKSWNYEKIILNSKEQNYSWIKGHASPCTLFSPNLISKNELLCGIVNGRETTKKIDGKQIYGKFRPGLFLFNPKTGEIPWVDSKPLFEDPDATTITFASEFVQTGKDKGILYCHVNDSFVRAYEIDAKELEKYLKSKVRF